MPLDLVEYSDTNLRNMEFLSSNSLTGVSNSATRPAKTTQTPSSMSPPPMVHNETSFLFGTLINVPNSHYIDRFCYRPLIVLKGVKAKHRLLIWDKWTNGVQVHQDWNTSVVLLCNTRSNINYQDFEKIKGNFGRRK